MELIKSIHSYWSYLVLVILVLAVANAIIGLSSKKEFANKDLRLGLFTLIFSHIQLLLGLALYFGGSYASQISSELMSEEKRELRFVVLEHPITMILAIALITIGWSKHKKKEASNAKFKTFAIFYGLGLLLVLLRIPWKVWLGL